MLGNIAKKDCVVKKGEDLDKWLMILKEFHFLLKKIYQSK